MSGWGILRRLIDVLGFEQRNVQVLKPAKELPHYVAYGVFMFINIGVVITIVIIITIPVFIPLYAVKNNVQLRESFL